MRFQFIVMNKHNTGGTAVGTGLNTKKGGPRRGLGELVLPENEPGSSIMPSSNLWLDVMNRKIEVHEGIINLLQQKNSGGWRCRKKMNLRARVAAPVLARILRRGEGCRPPLEPTWLGW
ncbi:hypothetical protein GUJ93_ZPchr0001g31307 [Zizania palustris]|uniref:Uncharacterized protein n=1 Tax=Zizania palustris TaxID=103762 RepID=A0A8J5RVU7_ZIZPA|nr:hypothetical protein GUJ93_ZPchr0001g31307 [Zizania palustris]